MSEGGDEGLPRATPEPCVVCFSQPPTQLQLVCGHAVLCEDCCAVLLAQGEAQCPVCRGVLGECLDLADVLGDHRFSGDIASRYWPPEDRLNMLLAFLRGALNDEVVGEGDHHTLAVSALHTLGFFAEHSPLQQQVALQGGALDAFAVLVCQKPLDHHVLFIASVAVAGITKVNAGVDAAILRVAWESSGALKIFLHVLRLLKGATPDTLLSPLIASINAAFKVLPLSAGSRDVVALSKLVCDLSADNDNPEEDEQVQDLSLALLATLTTRSVCTSSCVAELLRAMRAVDMSHSKTLRAAIAMLHTAIVENEPAKAAACCCAALDDDVNGVATLLNACTLLCDDGCDETLGICASWLLPTIGAVCASAPAALMSAVQLGSMTVFAHLCEAAAEKESLDLSFALFQLFGRLLCGKATECESWRDARAAVAAAAVSADLPHLMTAMSNVAVGHILENPASGHGWLCCSPAVLSAVAGLLQHKELSWEGLGEDLASFCQFGVYKLARQHAHLLECARTDLTLVCQPDGVNHSLLTACRVLLDILQRSSTHCALPSCKVIRLILWGTASVASEAVLVAACQLLSHVVVRHGAGAAALDLVSRAVELPDGQPTLPLAAMLTPFVVQRTKPALRVAAQQTLALLLAIAVAAEDSGTA